MKKITETNVFDAGNGKDVVEAEAGNDIIDLGNGKDLIIENINTNRDGVDFLDGNNGMDVLVIKGTAHQLDILAGAIAAFKLADKSIEFSFGDYLVDNGIDRDLFDVTAINIEGVQLEELDNTGPVAEADYKSVTEDDTPMAMGNVLDNDMDHDWKDVMTVTEVEFGTVAVTPDADGEIISGAYGDLLLKSDGSYTYTLNAAAQALNDIDVKHDVFKYTISDGNGGVHDAELDITVNGKDEPPGFDLGRLGEFFALEGPGPNGGPYPVSYYDVVGLPDPILANLMVEKVYDGINGDNTDQMGEAQMVVTGLLAANTPAATIWVEIGGGFADGFDLEGLPFTSDTPILQISTTNVNAWALFDLDNPGPVDTGVIDSPSAGLVDLFFRELDTDWAEVDALFRYDALIMGHLDDAFVEAIYVEVV